MTTTNTATGDPTSEPPPRRILSLFEPTPDGVYLRFGQRRLRFEYALMSLVGVLAVCIAALAVSLRLGPTDVQRWGYPGLFAIALLRSASVVIPVPGAGITFAGGAFLDGHWGIPAPILVGLTVAFAESIGEFTGYAAGVGGSRMLEGGRFYQRVRSWVQRRAALTIFLMSLFPSFIFDVAGLAAGATGVRIRVFYPALLAGKTVRGISVATLGYYSVDFVESWF
jgi:uncharacterized membrane protein YdjX (TVP38/TMEM64 family)